MSTFLQLFCQKIPLLNHPSTFYFLPFFLLTFFLLKWLSSTSKTTKKNLPPSPPKLPILGNLHQLGSSPHRSLHSLAQKHGQFMLLHLGKTPALIVSSAEAAKEIMKTHDLFFSNRPKSSVSERLLYNYKDVSMAPYGEYWRQIRSICVVQLLSNKRVQSFRAVREEETVLMVQKIKQSCLFSLPVDLSEIFMLLTNDVVCRVALGRKYGGGDGGGRRFKELLAEFAGLLGGFFVGDFIPCLGWVNRVNGLDAKVDKVAKEFDCFLDEVVEEHMQRLQGENSNYGCADGEKHNDFVDVLLEVQKDDSLGVSLSRVSIKAIILDMFAAGTDTTYTLLEWTMTELLRHPKVMKKLQDEVRGIACGKPNITEDDIEKMNYLKAVIKETLRLRPPLPILFPRESVQEIEVQGYDIAARTMVMINFWAIGRDPKSWDEPEEFWPERFLNSSIDFKGHDFQLIPFGAGRRGCPGTLFAVAINELALANLVNSFDWALPEGSEQDLDTTESTGITIHRKFPLLAVATPFSS